MKIAQYSTTLVTDRIAAMKAFYETFFDAKASFDCGWYVVLRLGGVADGPELCLMEPRDGATPYGGGTVLNVTVDDVDAFYEASIQKGAQPVMPLEDHPWGDRGFGFLDPAGQMVYCLIPIEPDESFKPYHISIT